VNRKGRWRRPFERSAGTSVPQAITLISAFSGAVRHTSDTMSAFKADQCILT
jgi:hypothetical protein